LDPLLFSGLLSADVSYRAWPPNFLRLRDDGRRHEASTRDLDEAFRIADRVAFCATALSAGRRRAFRAKRRCELAMASTSAVPIDNDQVVHLSVSWEAYKALSASMGDASSPRLIYDGETFEIVSPGSKHERIAARIADLLSAIVTQWDFNIESTRSTTFEAQPHGFEGDDTYQKAAQCSGHMASPAVGWW
jgi:hypothetical protein